MRWVSESSTVPGAIFLCIYCCSLCLCGIALLGEESLLKEVCSKGVNKIGYHLEMLELYDYRWQNRSQ